MKYCAKNNIIEAFKYDGDLMNSKGEYYVPQWAVDAFERGTLYYAGEKDGEPPCELFIKAGGMRALIYVGYYIIRDIQGDIRICDAEYFEENYIKIGE